MEKTVGEKGGGGGRGGFLTQSGEGRICGGERGEARRKVSDCEKGKGERRNIGMFI